jgi:hypothetical protein
MCYLAHTSDAGNNACAGADIRPRAQDMKVDTAKTLNTLEIGDRVIFRYSKTKACGTITQIFNDGVARVLWDSEEHAQLQFGDLLIKLPELQAPGWGWR